MKYAVNPFAPAAAAAPCPCFPLIFASTLQRCCSLNILTPASSKVLTSAAGVAGSALPVHFNPTIFSEANERAVCCNFAVRFSPPALFSGPQFSVVVVSARWCVLLSQIKRNHCCGTRYLLPIPPRPSFHSSQGSPSKHCIFHVWILFVWQPEILQIVWLLLNCVKYEKAPENL